MLELVTYRLASHFHSRFGGVEAESVTYPDLPLRKSAASSNSSMNLSPSNPHLMDGTRSPVLRPSSKKTLSAAQRHSKLDALDLANVASTSTTPEPEHEPPGNIYSLSRGGKTPDVKIRTGINTTRVHIIDVTKNVFYWHILYAFLIVILNLVSFGMIFNYLEGWNGVIDGLYFSYCVLTTIGYGDYRLTHEVSKALFIWHVFLGFASITYLSSMASERILDSWTIECERIERRVGRYQTKAKLKQIYGNQPIKPRDVFQKHEEHHEPDSPPTLSIPIIGVNLGVEGIERHKIFSYKSPSGFTVEENDRLLP